jgi:hypothetical protein
MPLKGGAGRTAWQNQDVAKIIKDELENLVKVAVNAGTRPGPNIQTKE